MKYVEKIDESILLKGKLCGDDIGIDSKYNRIKINSNSKMVITIRDTDDNSTYSLTIHELFKHIRSDSIGHIVNVWIYSSNSGDFYVCMFPVGEITYNIIDALKYWSFGHYRDTYWLDGIYAIMYKFPSSFILTPDTILTTNIIYMSKSGRSIVYFKNERVVNKIDNKVYKEYNVGYLLDGHVENEKSVIISINSDLSCPNYEEFVQLCRYCKPYIDIVRNI